MSISKKALFALALVLAEATGCSADLRMACTPKGNYKIETGQNALPFVSSAECKYMEPSDFGYQGLKNQRQNNYDNFLRSNVDNEQDNRDFEKEAGQDMLPFRTLNGDSSSSSSPPITMTIGQEKVIPLRWNNPHSSECELNIWITGAAGNVVVPIKKPVCCGEGYQDAVISAIVPADFNQLASKVPGFNGCNKVGDCVLQLYAHSVEPRTYAIGSPLILQGGDNINSIAKASRLTGIAPATSDPGMDLSRLTRDVCLPTNNPASNIASAQPRFARLVSDQFNHAYQSSNFSPYSGQQHESISKNMQAAAVVRMITGNRGELGKSILTQDQQNLINNLANKVNNRIQSYETVANNIVGMVGELQTSGTIAGQQIKQCFRCLEVGSVNHNRQQTATYYPSYELPNGRGNQIKQGIQNEYKNVISPSGVVQIYAATLQDFAKDFQDAAAKGIKYMPAMLKTTMSTMQDPTQFKKLGANGQPDGGKYAATMAAKLIEQNAAAISNPAQQVGDFASPAPPAVSKASLTIASVTPSITSTVSVRVNYNVPTSSVIVTGLMDSSFSQWYGGALVKVGAGSGSTTIQFDKEPTTPAGNNFIITSYVIDEAVYNARAKLAAQTSAPARVAGASTSSVDFEEDIEQEAHKPENQEAVSHPEHIQHEEHHNKPASRNHHRPRRNASIRKLEAQIERLLARLSDDIESDF